MMKPTSPASSDCARSVGRREDTEVVGVVGRARRHHLDALALREAAIDHAHQHHDADIGIEPAVDDHRAQRRIGIAARSGHLRHDGFENLVDAHARLRRTRNRIGRIDADHILDLRLRVVGIGLRQIHLVEHRHHLDTEVERGVAVGNGLRFYALARIDDEQCAFACRERATHFIREVDMARRVDQIEVVDLAVARLVVQRSGLCLDGYPTLLLDLHRVENLRFHLAICKSPATLDQAICKRRLAVIDVRNDRKISDVIHQRERLST